MLENREGQRVPEVVFRAREGGEWRDIHSRDVFAGRKVIVFSLPGAFTPTCSSSHVPRYDELAPMLRAHGIDGIACVSVNDGFVMEVWKRDQRAENILFLPDGNGEFTRKMGMLVDKSDLGFGPRSWRYSMLVDDGVIRKMFIEPEVPGDPFEVSDADTMLRYLAPDAQQNPDIALFTKEGCAHCARAKQVLAERGLAFEEIPADHRVLRALSGKSTTPQVFIGGRHIGGADDLIEYLESLAQDRTAASAAAASRAGAGASPSPPA
jgi:glutathione-dependent peroxiredoxin